MASGCTSGTNGNTATETPMPQNTLEQTPTESLATENTVINVSWPQDDNPVPPYTDEEKQQLVKVAKQEIMRLFPDVKEDTLENYSWGRLNYGSYKVPSIDFNEVAESSESQPEYVEIRYDPERKNIGLYSQQ